MINKNTSIILRLSEQENKIIHFKSLLFGKNKSDYIRSCSLSYMGKEGNGIFKEITRLYKDGDENTKNLIIDAVFEYYRRKGFPHPNIASEAILKRLERVIKTPSPLLSNNELQTNTVGLDIANYFHPHMVNSYYSGYMNAHDAYNDDKKFRDCIKRWLDMGNYIDNGGMRRILKTRNGVKSVTDFKPVIARFVYDTYAPINGFVLDPCCGYSGRLIGALASKNNINYHGIDPDINTIQGNLSCYNILKDSTKCNCRFYLGCAEDIMPEINREYDVIFTSPPYFDLEIYSDNKNQSSSRYKAYSCWLEKFMYVIIAQSKRLLKENGKLIINVKNTVKYKLADDVKSYVEKTGLTLETEYKMRLVNNEYNRNGKSMFHHEPIFVFSK